MSRTIIIGSRGSALAKWQADYTCDELKKLGYQVEIKYIKTQGDIINQLNFDKLEGKGFFTKEIEEELVHGTIDLAVHSYKDLPTDNPPGLIVAGCSYSEDPADWLLIKQNAYDDNQPLKLKQGAVVGTSSARRKSQLLALRPDLTMRDIRGNVPTRVEKLDTADYDAIVLAAAGLNRLELDVSRHHTERLRVLECVSAPAQGVLAYQIRENDNFMQAVIGHLNDPDVARDIAVERGILKKLGGGCQQPIGVYCETIASGEQAVWVAYAKAWNDFPQRVFMADRNAKRLVERVVETLKNRGNKSVFITRNLQPDSFFSRALAHYGYTVYAQSLLHFEAIAFDPHLPNADWVFFSSKNGVEFFFDQKPILPPNIKFAAVGEATANAVKKYGYKTSFVGMGADTTLVAFEFAAVARDKHILFPQPANSLQTVQKVLGDVIKAKTLVVYQNTPIAHFDIPVCDILLFTSPANAQNYYRKYPVLPHQKIIAIGTTTARALSNMGIHDYVISHSSHEISLVDICY